MWTYRFSQLKSSSDDGRNKLKLQFNNDMTKQVDTRVNKLSEYDYDVSCIDIACLIYLSLLPVQVEPSTFSP